MTMRLRIKDFILAAFALTALSSCVYESEGDCGTYLRFVYEYNMQGTDGFSEEADRVSVYVFDAQGRLVTSIDDQVLGDDGTLMLPKIQEGQYKIVAWAKSDRISDDEADFDMSRPTAGGSISELQAKLKTEDSVSSHRLNSLLNGVLDTEITGRGQHLTVSMMKCNNDLRVVLMPIRASQTFSKDMYEIKVEAQNAWLAYDASAWQQSPVEYHTYLYEQSTSDTGSDETINTAVIGDLALSRLFDSDNSRLIVTNKMTGREILNIRLEWMLTLQAISEHRSEWSDQEYLDRQDEYSITFFVDDSTWMETRIIVNGWVLSLDDATLL